MADHKKNVEIHGELFAIDKIPNLKTALVESAKDALLGDVDLKVLVTDLSKLGNLLRIAYNGVSGHTELQIKVQGIGFTITELADKSAVTVHIFKTTSRDVLEGLQGTYEYLVGGFEDMALVTFSSLAALAGKLSNASDELHKDFEAAIDDVRGALMDTQTAKGTDEETKNALQSLSLIMMNEAQFWKQMNTNCEDLAGKELQTQIEIAMKSDYHAIRLNIWTSSMFKNKAINYYAKWVALDEVCGAYMQQIKRTRADLYKYLEENPTTEESRRNVRDMATTFITEMREEQNDIDKLNLKTDQEIEEVKHRGMSCS